MSQPISNIQNTTAKMIVIIIAVSRRLCPLSPRASAEAW
jgi:hypothetical protein